MLLIPRGKPGPPGRIARQPSGSPSHPAHQCGWSGWRGEVWQGRVVLESVTSWKQWTEWTCLAHRWLLYRLWFRYGAFSERSRAKSRPQPIVFCRESSFLLLSPLFSPGVCRGPTAGLVCDYGQSRQFGQPGLADANDCLMMGRFSGKVARTRSSGYGCGLAGIFRNHLRGLVC